MLQLNLTRDRLHDLPPLEVRVIEKLKQRPYLRKFERRVFELLLKVCECEVHEINRRGLDDLVRVQIIKTKVAGAVLEFWPTIQNAAGNAILDVFGRQNRLLFVNQVLFVNSRLQRRLILLPIEHGDAAAQGVEPRWVAVLKLHLYL